MRAQRLQATFDFEESTIPVYNLDFPKVFQQYCDQDLLPTTIPHPDGDLLATTLFVKYNYAESAGKKNLVAINVIALPSGLLQD
ncbi:MAG: Type restriction enzyme SfiI, partial [Dehalococcoidia bacterium]|nr:Type restriction enzyme SfiI [Dehalococcoidia bacterium]